LKQTNYTALSRALVYLWWPPALSARTLVSANNWCSPDGACAFTQPSYSGLECISRYHAVAVGQSKCGKLSNMFSCVS